MQVDIPEHSPSHERSGGMQNYPGGGDDGSDCSQVYSFTVLGRDGEMSWDIYFLSPSFPTSLPFFLFPCFFPLYIILLNNKQNFSIENYYSQFELNLI